MNDSRPDIWILQTRFDTQGLIAALRHDDSSIRRRAAAALRALGATEAIPHLKTALGAEQDPDTRAALVAALATLESDNDRTLGLIVEPPPEIGRGLPTVIKPPPADRQPPVVSTPAPPSPGEELSRLLDQLKEPDEAKVIAAIEQLTALRDKQAVERLVAVFDNASRSDKVRLAAAEALLALESAPVDVVLLGTLRNPNWRVRRNGAAILGQIRATWAVEPLAKALKDENEIVRRTAQAALKRINTPAARQALGVTRPSASESRGDDPSPTQRTRPRASGRVQDTVRSIKQGTLPNTPTDKLQPPAERTGTSHTDETRRTRPAVKPQWPRRAPSQDPRNRDTKNLNPDVLEQAKDRLSSQETPQVTDAPAEPASDDTPPQS